jgi:hypothetical protein
MVQVSVLRDILYRFVGQPGGMGRGVSIGAAETEEWSAAQHQTTPGEDPLLPIPAN